MLLRRPSAGRPEVGEPGEGGVLTRERGGRRQGRERDDEATHGGVFYPTSPAPRAAAGSIPAAGRRSRARTHAATSSIIA